MRNVVTWAAIVLTAFGCSSTQLRNKELAMVAKDWSLVIRASQVIPVYPLTEDLQPGDIFLVQVPIDRQQEIYAQRGFLPLDNMIQRINPTGYKKFYGKSFGAGEPGKPLPKHWLAPGKPEAWSVAPNASFPTYSFSVRSGGGFNLALPVQGVPVGLSLMGGGAAEGTVTIADARTYGVDTASLYDDVQTWASRNRSFLSNFAPDGDKRNYLRVVTRVYLAGRLNVSLQSSRSFGATASAGAPKPVDLVVPTAGKDPEKVTLKTYTDNIETLNKMLEGALKKIKVKGVDQFLPGGTVKVVSASAGSISLSETFNRPLVIGYLGFDMAVLPGGDLGSPISTHAVLEKISILKSSVFTEDESSKRISAFIWKDGKRIDEKENLIPPIKENLDAVRKWMDENGLQDLAIQKLLDNPLLRNAREEVIRDLPILPLE